MVISKFYESICLVAAAAADHQPKMSSNLRITLKLFLFSLICVSFIQNDYCVHCIDDNLTIDIDNRSPIDLCSVQTIDSAARIEFDDNYVRYFVSNGHFYWLFDKESAANHQESLNEQNAFKIPYDFEPDIAIVKDTRKCTKGYRSLLLIQMKQTSNDRIEWYQLEMMINRFNSSTPISWNRMEKIANCDLNTQICTTRNQYFMTMSFDFKQKLDSAFGHIGNVAYFVQQDKLFKVLYKDQCIDNPYAQIIAYPGIPLGTTTTAALIETYNDTYDIVLFDHNVHYRLPNQADLQDILFTPESLQEPSNWLPNNPDYFNQSCPQPTAAMNLKIFLKDFFNTNSKRDYRVRRIVHYSLVVLLLITLILLSIIAVFKFKINQNLKPNPRGQHLRMTNGLKQTNLDNDEDNDRNGTVKILETLTIDC